MEFLSNARPKIYAWKTFPPPESPFAHATSDVSSRRTRLVTELNSARREQIEIHDNDEDLYLFE